MAEHKLGSMDIEVQEKTFDGFMSFVSKTVVCILVLLVLMAIFII
ncbi:aa3-type cytochrome c oxidase subunit IV [Marinibacterium profundimaris]|uniref:Cytochrome C oxidase subunit IV n=1 Tax=Marinibacterium profundimaris TaxID=1679460 RepID=A0A225NLM6_9RHOB|nr:aa3-type cytochrome c oxidase subunit IV [Marinibacterium profundimaris]OWU73378.1 cytochrome C oxidase subunit IV [Marinibacterium profundimaris]